MFIRGTAAVRRRAVVDGCVKFLSPVRPLFHPKFTPRAWTLPASANPRSCNLYRSQLATCTRRIWRRCIQTGQDTRSCERCRPVEWRVYIAIQMWGHVGASVNVGGRDFRIYRVAKKFGTICLYALTLSNINRFTKLFHSQNQKKICHNAITENLTTPQVCRYTAMWHVVY